MTRRAFTAALAVAVAWSAPAAAGEGAPAEDEPIVVVEDGPPPSLERGRVTVTGRFATFLAADLAHDDDEDHAALLSRLELGGRWESDPAWLVRAGGRLTWVGRAGSRDDAGVHGLVEGELVDGFVRWRSDFGLEVAAGLQRVAWSMTQAESPFAPFSPEELRFGPDAPDALPPLGEWALSVSQTWPALTLTALYVPTFRASRADVVGTDWAVLQPSARLSPPDVVMKWAAAREAGRGLFDDEAVRLRATSPPPEGLIAGASTGARAALHLGAFDAALGWAYRWDPVPLLRLDDAVRRGFRTGHLRQHVIGGAVSWAVAPVVVRAEVAWRSAQTVYRWPSLTAARPAVLHGVVEASAAPAPWLDAAVAVAHERLLGDELGADEALFLARTSETRLHARLGVALAWAGAVRLVLRTRWAIERGDLLASADLTWRVSALLEARVGLRLFEGGGDGGADGVGIAGLYDGNDYAYLGATLSF